jgi:poly(3-hydroxybutyrate) depolymerase
MRYLLTYDFMESHARDQPVDGVFGAGHVFLSAAGLFANPMIQMTAAWGEVTERTFERMVAKPDWGIYSVVPAMTAATTPCQSRRSCRAPSAT